MRQSFDPIAYLIYIQMLSRATITRGSMTQTKQAGAPAAPWGMRSHLKSPWGMQKIARGIASGGKGSH